MQYYYDVMIYTASGWQTVLRRVSLSDAEGYEQRHKTDRISIARTRWTLETLAVLQG